MKTKYLAEAQAAITAGKVLTNAYALDLAIGFPYIGLLSSLPNEGGDGVEGMGELYGGGGTAGYERLPLILASFTNPELVYSTELASSGYQTTYNAEVSFNPATENWGSVVGVVVFYARVDGGSLRITPMYTAEFETPVTINTNNKLVIPNLANAKLKFIELIRKQVIQ